MLVNITFDDEESLKYVDIVNIPDEAVGNLDEVVSEFLKWMFDKTNNHKYWVIEEGKKKYCSFTTEAFIDWLNEFVTKEEKATIIAISSRQIDETLPVIFF